MTIDSSGFVGIGNTSPSSSQAGGRDLVIGAGSGDRGLSIMSGTSGVGHIEFSDGTSSAAEKTAGGIRYYHNGNYMRFNTNGGTERMRIDSSGNVGIGTTSPGAKLDIGGLTNTTGQNVDALKITRTDGLQLFGINWNVSANEVSFSGNTKNYVFKNKSSSAESIRFPATGGITFNGDTATANALSDYEEGSYTPTLTGISGTTSITLYEDKLSYTKIGTRIMISGRLRMNVSNYSGGLRMSLPFAAASGTSCSNCGMSAVGTHGVNFATSSGTGHNMGLFIETFAGQSLADFVITKDNDSWVNATSSNIAQYNYLAFNMHYQTS